MVFSNNFEFVIVVVVGSFGIDLVEVLVVIIGFLIEVFVLLVLVYVILYVKKKFF